MRYAEMLRQEMGDPSYRQLLQDTSRVQFHVEQEASSARMQRTITMLSVAVSSAIVMLFAKKEINMEQMITAEGTAMVLAFAMHYLVQKNREEHAQSIEMLSRSIHRAIPEHCRLLADEALKELDIDTQTLEVAQVREEPSHAMRAGVRAAIEKIVPFLISLFT